MAALETKSDAVRCGLDRRFRVEVSSVPKWINFDWIRSLGIMADPCALEKVNMLKGVLNRMEVEQCG